MIKEGDKAPDFTLPGSDGKDHTLGEFRGKLLVLYFYPRDMTPGCTIEANNFNKHLDELKGMGAEVVGVSNDSVESHGKFAGKCKLDFLLLSDQKSKMIKDYDSYANKGIFGFGTVRNTYIIKDGTVIRAFGKVNAVAHINEVLDAVKELNQGK